jgi:hypothetical protein
MAFTFRRYGTFTGPGTDIEYRDNDDFSVDPFEGYFNLDDVSMVLVNTVESPADYVYMHLAGSSTSTVTLERSTGPIPTFNVESDQTNFSGDIDVVGTVTANDFVGTWYGNSVGSVKAFDISHPSKEGYRLRYICLEGPEAEVYLRGKLEGSNTIHLPDYWKNLVDIETVGVTLTPIGVYQELFVEKIEWGQKIIVKNNLGGPINCSYVVHGQRKDVPRNITEYEGASAKDYPGEIVPYTP